MEYVLPERSSNLISMATLVKFLALKGSSRDYMKKKEKDEVGEVAL